jgi:hypothetical protein
MPTGWLYKSGEKCAAALEVRLIGMGSDDRRP